MRYADGNEPKVGDRLLIDGKYKGVLVADIDAGQSLPGHHAWAYLGKGLMVDTDFGGLVHYTETATDDLRLLSRGQQV